METQKKLILKYSKKKDPDGHYDEILCMDIHPNKNMLLTAGYCRGGLLFRVFRQGSND